MSQAQCCSFRGEAQGEVFTVRFEANELALDVENTRSLAAALSDLARDSSWPELRLDLRNVVALTTMALAVLVTLRRQLFAGGRRLTLCNLQPAVAEVFEISKLNRLFLIRREEVPVPSFSPAA